MKRVENKRASLGSLHTNPLHPVSCFPGFLFLRPHFSHQKSLPVFNPQCFSHMDTQDIFLSFLVPKDHIGRPCRLHCWVSIARAWLSLWFPRKTYLRSSHGSAAGSCQDTVCMVKVRRSQLGLCCLFKQ